MKAPEGYLHSIQTLGGSDGPGLRFVAFLQGCPLRCAYCHNPDTWPFHDGKPMDAAALVRQAVRYKPYFGGEGGLTLSGGEPLGQLDFCQAVAREARRHRLHLCIDTSGYRFDRQVQALYESCDLVLLDIKHAESEGFRRLTGRPIEGLRRTLEYFRQSGRPVWLRQVYLPGVTDSGAQFEALQALAQGLNIRRLQLLPYHRLGREKWEALGLPYALEGMPVPNSGAVQAAQERLARQLGIPPTA